MEISKVQQIIEQVNAFKPSKIVCFIDSEGGDAQTGMSIYNFLKLYQAKVEVRIIGLAGSIASVIAMAANKGKLFIAKNGFMMIHKAEGMAWGTGEELRAAADLVDLYTGQIVDIYSQRTGKTTDEVNALIAGGDYWMSGADAVTQGFADDTFNDVTDNLNIAARLDLDVYKNLPVAIRAQLNKPPVEENPGGDSQLEITKIMKNFGEAIVNLFKNHKPATGAPDHSAVLNQVAEIMKPGLDEFSTDVDNRIAEATKPETIAAAIKPETLTAAATEVVNKINFSEGTPKAAIDTAVTNHITAQLQATGDNPIKTFISNLVTEATAGWKTKATELENQLTGLLGKQGGSGSGAAGGEGGYVPRGKINK